MYVCSMPMLMCFLLKTELVVYGRINIYMSRIIIFIHVMMYVHVHVMMYVQCICTCVRINCLCVCAGR